MTTDTIREVTASVIAVIIVAGGGAILFLQPMSPVVPFVTSLIGGAAGFYLSHVARSSGANMVLRAQDAMLPPVVSSSGSTPVR